MASLEEQRKEEVNFASLLNGVGSLTSAQTHNLRGINNNLNGTMAPTNKDRYGVTFFTRPDLNMSYDNLSMDRMLSVLLSKDTKSMSRALRCMLSPRLEDEGVLSDIADPEQAFIPILTNNLLSMSGWPDFTVDTYSSKGGAYREAYSMVDGTSHLYEPFDVTANFKNIQGDPITLMFAIWVRYESLVYDGTIVPYFDNILQNTIDYQTRIYRLVLNESFTYVQKIAATGAAFPVASPLGNMFNYAFEEDFNLENDQISIPFRCIGANYLDPILVTEFNKTVEWRCGGMRDKNRLSSMIKIGAYEDYPPYGAIGGTLLNLFMHQLYPRIEPLNYELEWWVKKAVFDAGIAMLKAKGALVTNVKSEVQTLYANTEHLFVPKPKTDPDASLGTSGNANSNIA
jgi:hypothetical protein